MTLVREGEYDGPVIAPAIDLAATWGVIYEYMRVGVSDSINIEMSKWYQSSDAGSKLRQLLQSGQVMPVMVDPVYKIRWMVSRVDSDGKHFNTPLRKVGSPKIKIPYDSNGEVGREFKMRFINRLEKWQQDFKSCNKKLIQV